MPLQPGARERKERTPRPPCRGAVGGPGSLAAPSGRSLTQLFLQLLGKSGLLRDCPRAGQRESAKTSGEGHPHPTTCHLEKLS